MELKSLLVRYLENVLYPEIEYRTIYNLLYIRRFYSTLPIAPLTPRPAVRAMRLIFGAAVKTLITIELHDYPYYFPSRDNRINSYLSPN